MLLPAVPRSLTLQCYLRAFLRHLKHRARRVEVVVSDKRLRLIQHWPSSTGLKLARLRGALPPQRVHCAAQGQSPKK